MRWTQALQANTPALDDFDAWITTHTSQATAEHESATRTGDLGKAQIALATKDALLKLQLAVHTEGREERDAARRRIDA